MTASTRSEPRENHMSRIAVIGTGYVGLTTGAYLAHLGHSVVCADVVESKVERLNRGEIPIVEAGLEELVQDGLAAGRLSFMLGAGGAVPGADFVFLCLPTPQGADGAADLSFVLAAAKEIGPALEPGAVVINKSTVPVGSAVQVTLALASNPPQALLRRTRARLYEALTEALLRDFSAAEKYLDDYKQLASVENYPEIPEGDRAQERVRRQASVFRRQRRDPELSLDRARSSARCIRRCDNFV